MKNKILLCLTFLFLFISSYGSSIYFCKKCKNKGYFYTYEICSFCGGSGTVTSYLTGQHSQSTRTRRCSNCSKIGCGDKIGYIRVKKNCSCSNGKSNCKNKKKKRYIDPKLKTFFKR